MNKDIFSEHRVTAAERRIEENFANTTEAFSLLGLINAEFQSDPMSTQCFDARIVERVKLCVAKRCHFNDTDPLRTNEPRYVERKPNPRSQG